MSTTAFEEDLRAAREADELQDSGTTSAVNGTAEAEPNGEVARRKRRNRQTESLGRPWRLGIVGLGIAFGLVARLMAANGLADLLGEPITISMAVTSTLVGLGLLAIASERDRLGLSLAWIAVVTAGAFATLNWVSPPFRSGTGRWDEGAQLALSILGGGNGLLLAGIITLALVRRSPTFTIAATLVAAVLVLASNTVALRSEWAAITLTSIAFGLVLVGWDRSPRREALYRAPGESPRTSRAALSLASVALCGTAIQLWVSRGRDIPRTTPAIAVAVVLLAAAFASMIRVRREIERRETTLSEWSSWFREIRTNDFRSEIENFASARDDEPAELPAEPPRALSFPNLVVGNDAEPLVTSLPAPPVELVELPEPPEIVLPRIAERPPAPEPVVAAKSVEPPKPLEIAPVFEKAPAWASGPAFPTADLPRRVGTLPRVGEAEPEALLTPGGSGIFSRQAAAAVQPAAVQLTTLEDLSSWLQQADDNNRLVMAIECMPLEQHEQLAAESQAEVRAEISVLLASTDMQADKVAWVDGPYFMASYAAVSGGELSALNSQTRNRLRAGGTLAMLRPGADVTIDQLINEAVIGLTQARLIEAAAVPAQPTT